MITKKCKDCDKCIHLANTEETGHAFCSAPTSYIPIKIDNECIFSPKPYTCGDCARYGEDTACMSCLYTDSAYHNGHLCGGFIDKHEDNMIQALFDWMRRDYNIDEKINYCKDEARKMYSELPINKKEE